MAADTISVDPASVDPARIVLPRNSLVVLVGPAGSGKSTFAAAFFGPTQVVSSDECRALISDDASNQQVSCHAFELMHLLIEKRLLLGRLTVCDATNLEPGARRPLMRLARRFGRSATAVVFDLSLETCISRNTGRRRVVPEEALRSQHRMLEKAKAAVLREGFDQVIVLREGGHRDLVVKISARARTNRAS
jgi:protein phosphatase